MRFLVTGLPRSGTAWLANWFTTDHSVCWHDALMEYKFEELMARSADMYFGCSETAICLMDPAVINDVPVKKLIVHRPLEEVNASLRAMGLPGWMTETHVQNLHSINGVHIQFKDLFEVDRFSAAHEWLVPIRFDSERYSLLRKMKIEDRYAIERTRELAQ